MIVVLLLLLLLLLLLQLMLLIAVVAAVFVAHFLLNSTLCCFFYSISLKTDACAMAQREVMRVASFGIDYSKTKDMKEDILEEIVLTLWVEFPILVLKLAYWDTVTKF